MPCHDRLRSIYPDVDRRSCAPSGGRDTRHCINRGGSSHAAEPETVYAVSTQSQHTSTANRLPTRTRMRTRTRTRMWRESNVSSDESGGDGGGKNPADLFPLFFVPPPLPSTLVWTPSPSTPHPPHGPLLRPTARSTRLSVRHLRCGDMSSRINTNNNNINNDNNNNTRLLLCPAVTKF